MPITIGVVRETAAGERRVALVPEVAAKFAALGAKLVMEKGAGTAAAFPDSAYKNVEFVDTAAAVLAQLPADSKDELVIRARAALALAAEAPADHELADLIAQVNKAPDDHAARFELAGALAGRGDRDAAAEHLLAIIKADRTWNESAAREKLLTMFEAAGLADPWSIKTRAALRAVWFA
jgi:thioredoxin-like negative regulator of GroEL